ncbi:NAD(P)-binding protein [Myriangium duriaei CBS 260.36]|uniref:NAD(P)-binding protein n=1 Tax=Myriangium duriaei CBS 260.36 TaxID=1168546 RepID=A0A9P4MGF2_9PEZI|nr:NAD(P)-binding protein [Myriangium duriaei CBS 260.36]
MRLGLERKIVVLVGGTRGIGRDLVEGFLAEGAHVHCCGRMSAYRACAAFHGRLYRHSVNASDANALKDCVQFIGRSYGDVDVVVGNVAGFSESDDAETWTQTYATELQSLTALCTAAIPYLRRSRGNIVAVASSNGNQADLLDSGPHGAITAGVVHYMTQLALTLAPRGIRVNVVSPDRLYIQNSVSGQEVADAVVWIASERAAFVSGTNVVIDGVSSLIRGSD